MTAPRLDRLVVEHGLARSRSQAHALIVAGGVRVDGTVVRRPAAAVAAGALLSAETDPYVSRAAHKLLGALADLDLTVSGRALDAGSSTGGFTQVLLERGCVPVYAVDVGTDQLAEALVVVHHEVHYQAPLTYQFRPVSIECWVTDIRAASFTMAYEVFHEEPDRPDGRRVYLRATTVLTPFIFESERPRRISDGVTRRPPLANGA